MGKGTLACRRSKAPDTRSHELPFRRAGTAIRAPAAGGVDADYLGLDLVAPGNDFFNFPCMQAIQVAAILQGHSVKALALAADIDSGNKERVLFG
jgi:hypothetical protein